MSYNIIGILVRKPEAGSIKLQEVLTRYGNVIRNRLGIHRDEVAGGIIILDIYGDNNQKELFYKELDSIDGIEYKHINL
ncbi:MAG: hypothetical protein C0596_18090 [Marinilabiliales bacterium]|nr:MAG: hypothetical protein C0596_18090 [Marinilabiliales bacterium]